MDVVEAIKKIENLGSSLDHYEQRERLLRVGLGANVDKKADYVIKTGCYGLFSLAPVKSFIDLMHHFGVSYTFLSKEVCCGRNIVEDMFLQGLKDEAQRQSYEGFVRQCASNNLTQAKALGAKAMVTICAGCNTMWNRYLKDEGVEVLHYLDLILKAFNGSRLPLEVDFYEGCHRWHKFVPDFQESMIENSKKVMARVEGLVFREISSKLCCRLVPEKIFASSQTSTIVTPNGCCYGFLTRSRPADGPRVKFLAEILWESLGNTPR